MILHAVVSLCNVALAEVGVLLLSDRMPAANGPFLLYSSYVRTRKKCIQNMLGAGSLYQVRRAQDLS